MCQPGQILEKVTERAPVSPAVADGTQVLVSGKKQEPGHAKPYRADGKCAGNPVPLVLQE